MGSIFLIYLFNDSDLASCHLLVKESAQSIDKLFRVIVSWSQKSRVRIRVVPICISIWHFWSCGFKNSIVLFSILHNFIMFITDYINP